MGKGEALRLRRRCLVFFTLLLLQEVGSGAKHDEEEACAPSRCGNIASIRHPFRLSDDPAGCGDQRYELACENNVTLLSLFSGTYYVLGINYNNYTIRLVDAGLQEDDCSSLPRYSLHLHNFSDSCNLFRNGDPYCTFDYFGHQNMFEYIIYLNCSHPVVRDDALNYVDTAPCVHWQSEGHIYAILGGLQVGNWTDECQVKLIATTTRNWDSLLPNKNYTYADIHRVLSCGFELSWLPRACVDLSCPAAGDCYLNPDTEKLECYELSGVSQKLLLFVEDYLSGIFEGLLQIKGYKTVNFYSDSDPWEVRVMAMGVFTGRFVLPYVTVRFLLGIVLLFVWLIYTFRRRHLSMDENIEHFLQENDLMPIRYSYKQIKRMTRGFKDQLGEGGFGTVYKGRLRSGSHVAIKMLGKSRANGQEFINEVATIGRIHHVHVVRLVGFCVEGSKRALVYEFMSNGSLDKYIFFKEESVPLSYDKMHEISLGVARGIAYLHHGCDKKILHFDIKPHNILLDDNFIPKVSDFGLAKLYHVNDSIVTLTAAKGTIGYMAPELFYKNIGGVTYKADVYSFGMLLMEMTSRRKNSNPRTTEHSSQLYFPLWIYDQFTQEKDIEMVDLTKKEKDLVKKMFIVAWWCIQLKPIDRPSMNKVVEMLEANVESLEMPPKPLLYPNETIAKDNEFNSSQTSSDDYIHSSSYASDDIPENIASNGGK